MKKHIVMLGILVISFVFSCSDKGSSALFTVGGVVSGLTGTVVLQNNGGDDLTIGVNGPFTFAAAAESGSPYSVTVSIYPSGQTCVVSNGTGTILVSPVTNVSLECFARGGLDVTFSAPDGFLTQDSAAGGAGDDAGTAVAIDGQGRILVAGSSTNSAGNTDMAVWRYHADGTLDAGQNGFGGDGIVSASAGTGSASGNGIAVDVQGRVLVTGSTTTTTGVIEMALWRFNANGTLDTAFNGDGMVSAAVGTGNASGNAVAIDSQGRILVAGSSTNIAGNRDMMVWRFKADGTLDTSFNSPKGFVVHDGTAGGVGDDAGNAIAIDSQGRVTVAGSSRNSIGNTDMVVWRITPAGIPDSAFDGDGIVINNGAAGSDGDDAGSGVTIDSEDRIIVTGSSTNSAGNKDMVVWRLNADGALDITFATDGILTNSGAAGGTGNDMGSAVVVDSRDRIVATGNSGNAAGNADLAVWRVFP